MNDMDIEAIRRIKKKIDFPAPSFFTEYPSTLKSRKPLQRLPKVPGTHGTQGLVV